MNIEQVEKKVDNKDENGNKTRIQKDVAFIRLPDLSDIKNIETGFHIDEANNACLWYNRLDYAVWGLTVKKVDLNNPQTHIWKLSWLNNAGRLDPTNLCETLCNPIEGDLYKKLSCIITSQSNMASAAKNPNFKSMYRKNK